MVAKCDCILLSSSVVCLTCHPYRYAHTYSICIVFHRLDGTSEYTLPMCPVHLQVSSFTVHVSLLGPCLLWSLCRQSSKSPTISDPLLYMANQVQFGSCPFSMWESLTISNDVTISNKWLHDQLQILILSSVQWIISPKYVIKLGHLSIRDVRIFVTCVGVISCVKLCSLACSTK